MYLAELCDVVAIALAELPVLLQPTEVCEALLKLKYGPEMICHVVANQSDSFNCVVSHLINLGDKTEEEGGQELQPGAHPDRGHYPGVGGHMVHRLSRSLNRKYCLLPSLNG